MFYGQKIAVVVPAYRVEKLIAQVVSGIPNYIDRIIVVDDCSPDQTSRIVEGLNNPRVKLLRHAKNTGVGGAMKTGYAAALDEDFDIVVKMDGDNQMDPAYLPALLYPLVKNECDYIKGNRFSLLKQNTSMPFVRRIGNQILTFLNKLASGYWHIFDPQNGYLAIRSDILRKMRLDRIDNTYFFENSMLINLNIIEARVSDVYIPSRYGEEKSSMSNLWVAFNFPFKFLRGLFYRIFYRYVYLDFSPVAVLLFGGSILILAGAFLGGIAWYRAVLSARFVSAGTVALALLPILVGFQMLLNSFVLDISQSPKGKEKIYDFSKKEMGKILSEA